MNHYSHHKEFLYPEEATALLNYLEEEIPWRQVTYFKPNRGYVITPRLTWVAGFHQKETYSISTNSPNPIPDFLPKADIAFFGLVLRETGVKGVEGGDALPFFAAYASSSSSRLAKACFLHALFPMALITAILKLSSNDRTFRRNATSSSLKCTCFFSCQLF